MRQAVTLLENVPDYTPPPAQTQHMTFEVPTMMFGLGRGRTSYFWPQGSPQYSIWSKLLSIVQLHISAQLILAAAALETAS